MNVVDEQILEPGGATAFTVETGDRVELFQVEGMQVADLVSFDADDPDDRLGMYMSRAINHTWLLTEGHVLVSTDGHDLWYVEEDTVGDNYSGGGYCNPYVNARRSNRPDDPTCEGNLVRVLEPYGLTRRSFDADTCLNVFMRVAYEPDGSWNIEEPRCGPDDRIRLRAERRQIVGISNCPQLLNPVNAFELKSLGVRVLRPD